MGSVTAATERIRDYIQRLHGCRATWIDRVPVEEYLADDFLWRGAVDVFDLGGHVRATRCYGWEYEADDGRTHTLAVLHFPPVESAASAVRYVILAEDGAQELPTDNTVARQDRALARVAGALHAAIAALASPLATEDEKRNWNVESRRTMRTWLQKMLAQLEAGAGVREDWVHIARNLAFFGIHDGRLWDLCANVQEAIREMLHPKQ